MIMDMEKNQENKNQQNELNSSTMNNSAVKNQTATQSNSTNSANNNANAALNGNGTTTTNNNSGQNTTSNDTTADGIKLKTFKNGVNVDKQNINTSQDIYHQIKDLVASGNVFDAYSMAQDCYTKDPNNIKSKEVFALTLLKTGAIDDAKKIVTQLFNFDDIENFQNQDFVKTTDASTLAGIADIFKEAWTYTKDCADLDISRELYIASFNANHERSLSGINAAWMAWITGEDELAISLAQKVLNSLPQLGLNATFDQLILLAESQLIIGRVEDAIRIYTEAYGKRDQKNYLPIVKARQKLFFLKSAGVKIPDEVLKVLTPPTIVVFSGQMIDNKYQEYPIFPNELEDKVREAIRTQLDELDARIAYSSASAGAEILFLEEMLKRGGEINIILPFINEDFIDHNVRYAGPRWEKRFEKIIKNAHSVSYAVDDKFLGHSMLYRFSNQVIQGTAVMRGKILTSEPHLFVIWDSMAEPKPGDQSDFIDQWTNINTLHLVDIDTISNSTGKKTQVERKTIEESNINKVYKDPLTLHLPERSIRTMMFSDLSGYSKLQDEHVPDFLDFMKKLHDAINEIDLPMESINTWGDAIFAVSKDPIVMADFALLYCDVITRLGMCYPKFPHPIQARISLHSGPVYKAIDPFIEKDNFYGGHINRAARLEPVTKVGQVYATQQFVSILNAEINKLKNECMQKGIKFIEKFATEYIGVISLAKNFGSQEVYHIRKL